MSVKRYECLIAKPSTNETFLKSVAVSTNTDVFGYVYSNVQQQDNYWFNLDGNISIAETVSDGIFDSSTTFFTSTAGLLNSSLDTINHGNNFMLLIFPNGHHISIGSDGILTYNIGTSYAMLSSGYGAAFGLSSGRILYYDRPNDGTTIYMLSTPSIYYRIRTVSGQQHPVFGFSHYEERVYRDTLRTYPSYSGGYGTNYYEAPRYSSYAPTLERQSTFLIQFWNDIEAFRGFKHCCQMTIGQGGTVSPSYFFASANEPLMFTVTPDEHHAIHSVTAYNTTTNAQIPLQESGMDLLTGAKNYMFTMPAANVRIIVEFRSIEITIPVTVSYTSPRGRVFTTSFNLLYDDTEQRQETASPVEEGETQNE